MHTSWRKVAALCCVGTSVLVVVGTGSGATAAGGDDVLQVTALTGPAGGDITITLPDGADPGSIEHVSIRLFAPAGSTETALRALNLKAVAATDGSATVEIASLERGTAVIVQLHVREQSPPRTRVLRGATTAMLRPDLVVSALHAPAANALDQARRRRGRRRGAEYRHRRNGDADADAWPDAPGRGEDGDGRRRQHEGGDVRGREARDSDDRGTDGSGRERDAVRDRRDEQRRLAHDRGDRERARPLECARRCARRLRRPVQSARLRARHQSAGRDRCRAWRRR